MQTGELIDLICEVAASAQRPTHIAVDPRMVRSIDALLRNDPMRVASPAGLARLFPALNRNPTKGRR